MLDQGFSIHYLVMRVAVLALTMGSPSLAKAYDPGHSPRAVEEKPQALREVGIEEHLGDPIDTNLEFVDEDGRSRALRELIKGDKPVLLTFVYYGCPSLCNYHLTGLTAVAKAVPLNIGAEYQFIAVSIDPQETPDLAKQKKENYLKEYGRAVGPGGWHFLTGREENIQALAKQVGFNYHWDTASQQWAHAAAAYVLTPEGKISRYLYGIEFKPQDLRLALLEAGDGRIGTIIDRLVLFCFQFDPAKNRYTLYAYNIMRAGAGITVLILLLLMWPYWLRLKREKEQH